MPVEKTTPKKPSPQKKAPRKGFFSGLWAYEDPKEEVEERVCDEDDLIEPKGCKFCKAGPNGTKKCIGWLTKPVAKEPFRCVLSDAQGKKCELGSCTFIPPDSGIVNGIVYNKKGDPVSKIKAFIVPLDGIAQYDGDKPKPEPEPA